MECDTWSHSTPHDGSGLPHATDGGARVTVLLGTATALLVGPAMEGPAVLLDGGGLPRRNDDAHLTAERLVLADQRLLDLPDAAPLVVPDVALVAQVDQEVREQQTHRLATNRVAPVVVEVDVLSRKVGRTHERPRVLHVGGDVVDQVGQRTVAPHDVVVGSLLVPGVGRVNEHPDDATERHQLHLLEELALDHLLSSINEQLVEGDPARHDVVHQLAARLHSSAAARCSVLSCLSSIQGHHGPFHFCC